MPQNRYTINTEHRPLSWLVPVLCLLFLLCGGCKEEQKQPPPAPAPPEVTVERVTLHTVPVYLSYVATTEAVRTVDIRARVEGFLEKRMFVEGADVKKGDLVFIIEKAPYQAELEKSLAQLTRDKAALSFATEQVKRYRPLAEKDFVTQEALDQYETKAREAAAAVKEDEARIRQDRLNLSYCTMYSPLDGRIGRTLVNVGNLVGAGGEKTKLATIVQMDPLYVYFSPSEKDLRLILKYRKKKDIPVDIILSDGSTHPHPGKVDFIDNRADPKANTVNMRAVVPNPEETLLPGVYVQARLFLCDVSDAPLIPEKAIAEDQTGTYVYVVGKESKVEKRQVKAGFLYNHKKIIWKGLRAGDLVITEGLQRIRPGMVVRPVEARPQDHHTGRAPGDHPSKGPGVSSTGTDVETPQETRKKNAPAKQGEAS